ncbi:hypothetical protein VKT23_002784 [Stygiomarasmius scandens]|uniref:Uncharacterized protein n=1 Tax=Marasmiellus scandens TaxID=2682957 RepID=A0ABR1K0Z6_9AGAR
MELEFTKDMLNKAELVHQFALQSLTHIIMTHNKQQIEKRSKRVYPLLNTSSEPDLDLSSHTYEEIPGSRSYPLNPISPPTQSNPSLSAMNVTPPSTPPAFVIAPQGPVHNAAPNQQGFNFAPLLEAPNPMPVINQPQLPLQSTVQSSHKTSVTALLTMGFFGASIAWSTVFSGTRGNIALLAWAACTFIVATVCAASASLLITSEEQIIEKHQRCYNPSSGS